MIEVLVVEAINKDIPRNSKKTKEHVLAPC